MRSPERASRTKTELGTGVAAKRNASRDHCDQQT
jgi:hypothetical protein